MGTPEGGPGDGSSTPSATHDNEATNRRTARIRFENGTRVAPGGVWLWPTSREDPPVALFGDRLPGSSRLDYLNRFSLAWVETVLSEAASASGTEGRTCQATPEMVSCLEEFAQVALSPYPAWFDPMGPPVRWFSAAGLLLCLEPGLEGLGLAVIGRTAADVQRAVEAIPGSWPPAGRSVTEVVDDREWVLPF
ncbi:hypothetical protein ABZ726_06265 [Streptomyces hundungensis]|uniref:hypothetical protein n=1 Tax=Streptomyces hundungensis TaxID=1077946 RepID=UPI0033DE0D1A